MAKNLKKAKSFRFSDDEMEILDALKAKYKTYSAGIIAAARADLKGSSITKDRVIAWIESIDAP